MMLVALTSVLAAQNMTDLAVMNDRSAGNRVLQSEVSTVDNSVFLHPNRIRFDDRCLQIEGKDVFVLSGTFHYFRTPQPLWRDRLAETEDRRIQLRGDLCAMELARATDACLA